MLELLFQGFIEWIYGLILECWEYFASVLFELMSLDFAYLREHIPIIDTIRQIMLGVGWALLIGNLVFQATRGMAAGLGFDAEDPKLLFTRTFAFSFLLVASPQICELGLNMTSTVIALLEMPDAVDITFADEASFSGLTGSWLLVVICGIIVMFQTFKLIMEMAERYFILAVLTITSPLAFGMGGSRNTSDIFTGWCRMFGSMCLLMATNVMFVKMLLSVLSYYPSGLDVLPWMVLVVTIVKVAKKADSILARIGLNPAMTGDPLGRGFPGAMTMMVVRSMVSNAAHTLGRNGNQPRSGSGNSKPNAPTGPRSGGSGSASNVNAPSHANGYHHSTSAQQNSANPAFNQESISAQTVAAQTDTYNPPPKRWRAHSLKPRLLAPESSRTPRAKPPCRPAPDVHRAMWQLRRTMQRPRQQKPRPVRRIIVRILLSPSWTARSRRIRSRNRPYIPSRNPIRAAAHRHRIAAGLFCPVRQEKQQAKILRAAPISQPAAQGNRITAATHRGRRYRPSLHSSEAPSCSRLTHSRARRIQPLQMRCQTILHRCLPLRATRHSLSAAQEKVRCSLRIQKRRSSAVPLCRLRTWQARSQQQIIRLRLLLRDPVWQEIRLCHTAAHRQFPHKTVWQENNQILILHRSAIPQELVRGRSNRAVRRIRQRPVRQERSARPSAGVIPSPCSRRRAFPQMEIPRSRSRATFLPSNPTAWRSQAMEPAWMAALQIGSIPHPRRRYLRQRRLPTAKLVHLRVRPRGLMRRIRQNSALRSAQSPRRTAVQKSRYPRQRHSPTAKLVHLRARPRGLMRHVRQNSALRSAQFPHKAAAQKSRYRRLAHKLLLFPPLLPTGRAGKRLPQLLWAT